jgi:hypothetical protein
MRILTVTISAMALTLLVSAIPGLTSEDRLMDEMLLPKKDTCLLTAKNCKDNAYVLEQRIKLLQDEIRKGNLVYTDEELNILKRKLDDANRALEFIFDEGA